MTGKGLDSAATFRHDINALRALAVAGVLLFHFSVSPFGGGFAGVDVFFVISGFLMTEIILRRQNVGQFRILGFWGDRAKRIVPALVVMVVATLLFGYIFVDPMAYRAMGSSALQAILFTSNIEYWLAGGYFDSPQQSKWFLHTWSLSVEWQFYLLYPVAMWLLSRMVKNRGVFNAIYLAATGASLIVCIGAAVAWDLHPRIPTANFFLLPTRAWEMMLGGLVALQPWRLPQFRHPALHWAGLAAIGLAFVLFDSNTAWPSAWTLLPALGTAAIIQARHAARWAAWPGVRHIGQWSYSIYLWHWPIKVALVYFGVAASAPITAAAIGASIVLGAASFYLVEGPARRWLAEFKLSRWLIAGGATATVAGAALLVVSDSGLPDRQVGGRVAFAQLQAAAADWDYSCPTKRMFEANYPTCIIPGDGPGRVALVGDSHMQQWFGRYGRSRPQAPEIHFLTASGCPPLPQTSRHDSGRICFEAVQEIWRVLEREDFDTIVMEASWNFYTYDPAGELCFMSGNKCVEYGVGTSAYESALKAAMGQLAHRLSGLVARGVKVVVVLDTPTAGDAAPTDLARRRFSGISTTDDELTTKVLPANKLLADALEGSGVVVVNPTDFMCHAGRCSALDARGLPLYRDRGHLRSSTVRLDSFGFLDRFIYPSRAKTAS